ncbi:MAG: MFS transporter [Candidatus Nanohaloarchaea archaeon]
MVMLLEDPVNRLIGYKALHGFAVGLISIFIPVYLSQAGFSPTVVFSFLLADVATFAAVSLPAGYAVSRIGMRYSLLTSSLLYVTAFAALQSFTTTLALAYGVAALIGFAKAFHWIPVNAEFTAGSERERRGEKYGRLEALPSLLGPFAPLLGGAILKFLGFGTLVAVSVAFALASVLPLLPGKNILSPDFDISGLASTEQLDLWALYFLDGFATTAYVFLFPLFIYYVIGGALNLGGVKTVAGIGAALFALGTGNLSDRVGKTRLVSAGAAASALTYLLVPFIQTRSVAFTLSFFAGLTYMFYTIPLVSMIADIAEDENLLGFFSVREVFQGFGKIAVVAVTVTMLVQGSMADAFRVTFYLASASVLLLALVARKIDRRR